MSQGAPRTNKSAQSCLTLTIAIKCSASLAVSALQELPHSLYTFHRSSNQPSSKMGTPFNRADSGFNRPEYQGRGPNLADQYGQHRVPRRFQEAISYYNGRLNLQTLVDCLRAIWPNETEKTLDIHISLRRVLQHSSFRDREFGLCYRFAFKSYSQQYQGFYEIEKNAFNGVMDEKNMIKCLGTVQCVESPQSPSSTPPRSYNILLEYREDDLNEY
ncbi:hypothetical protein GGS24DRAFT_486290 [Hypoxylon argillaceum]|nr:hypothetical protein GGS24DRAFT_486290 [Hypoxylon argillaceum]